MAQQHTLCHNGKELDTLVDDEDDFDDMNDIHQPQQRNAANARERARMRVLSKAFCRLKTTLPWVPPDTKLSKLDTLRLATSYIAHLRAVLRLSENEPPNHNVHPVNMNWPFNFHVNWESNTKGTDQNVNTDWNSLPADSNDRKKYVSGMNYDTFYDFDSDQRYPSTNKQQATKVRQRNSSYYCQLEPSHRANSKYDLNYKSCAYYG